MIARPRLAWVVAAASIFVAAQATAASFTIDGGVSHQTPRSFLPGWWGGNDVFGEQPGYVGAQLTFEGVAGRPYLFTFEYVGFEAGWENELQTDGGDIRNKASGVPTAPGTWVAITWIATGGTDIVPFALWVYPDDSSGDKSVVNGANPGIDQGLPNFFLSMATEDLLAGTAARSGLVVWLALDDSGAGPDTDHDDWVGLVRVTPIAEPGSLLLLGAGLLGSAARLRRRAALATRVPSKHPHARA